MRNDLWPLLVILLLALLVVFGATLGCSFLSPGFDTRQAAETRDLMETTGEDLRSSINSTHAGTTVIAQTGGTVTPATQPGDTPTISTGEGGWVYYRESDPRDVLIAYAALGEQNAKAWQATLAFLRDVLPYLPQARPQQPQPVDEVAITTPSP